MADFRMEFSIEEVTENILKTVRKRHNLQGASLTAEWTEDHGSLIVHSSQAHVSTNPFEVDDD